jgi:tetratricopeptide (TPR) repeat protein
MGKSSLRIGKPARARLYFEEAMKLLQQWSQNNPNQAQPLSFLAESYVLMGDVCWRLGDVAGSDAFFETALDMCSQLVRSVPRDFSVKADLADVHGTYGDMLLRLNRVDAAKQHYEESLQWILTVQKKDPGDLSAQTLLARTYDRLGILARQRQQAERAKHFAQAAELWEGLVRQDAGDLLKKIAWVKCLARAGRQSEAEQHAESLSEPAKKNPELSVQLAVVYSACAAESRDPARRRYLEPALAALKAAVQLGYEDGEALKTDPDFEPLRHQAGFRALVEKRRSK